MKKCLIVSMLMIAFISQGCLHKITPLEKCNENDANACMKLGYSLKKNPIEANKAFEKACNLGNSNGCVKLVSNYRDDKYGTKTNIEKASFYAKKACNQGIKYACTMRTKPKTPEEIRKDEESSQKLIDCMVKIDKCKAKCMSNYNSNYRGGTLDVAQYHLNIGICVETCRTMKCF